MEFRRPLKLDIQIMIHTILLIFLLVKSLLLNNAVYKRIVSTHLLCITGALSSTSAGGERRRFGDPVSENTRKNRKRTPRLRHPMEIQADVRPGPF